MKLKDATSECLRLVTLHMWKSYCLHVIEKKKYMIGDGLNFFIENAMKDSVDSIDQLILWKLNFFIGTAASIKLYLACIMSSKF